jgi:hypothetical protein
MISLTPHPITSVPAATERTPTRSVGSLSSSDRHATNALPRGADEPSAILTASAASSGSRLSRLFRSRSFQLLMGCWLASIAVGIRVMDGWRVVGIITGAFAGTFAIHWVKSERGAAWFKSWSGEVLFTTHSVCPDCERACALVNPDLPTALPCQGRREVADCLICVRRVEFARGEGCPGGRRHLLANKVDKPRLRLCREQENAPARPANTPAQGEL